MKRKDKETREKGKVRERSIYFGIAGLQGQVTKIKIFGDLLEIMIIIWVVNR